MLSNISDFQEYKRKARRFKANTIEHLKFSALSETITDDEFVNQFFLTEINSIDDLEEAFAITGQYRPELKDLLEKRYFNISDETSETSVDQPKLQLQSLEQISDQ